MEDLEPFRFTPTSTTIATPINESWETWLDKSKLTNATKEYLKGAEGGPAGFMHWEYRFWVAVVSSAAEGKPLYGICRRCGATGKAFIDRRNHGTAGQSGVNCCLFLTKAYSKLLNAEQRCVICDQFTTKQQWGVLLCSPQCRTDWMYETFRPEALKAALDLVEKEHAA